MTDELAGIDVLLYLLNPKHYGTAENALLEAMSKGVIPVVLPNLAESEIVRHRENGLVIENPYELKKELTWLANNHEEQMRISQNAQNFVIKNYSSEVIEQKFTDVYKEIISIEKAQVDFRSAFGYKPYEFFTSFIQEKKSPLIENVMSLVNAQNPYLARSSSKGSIKHFIRAVSYTHLKLPTTPYV